MDLVRIGAGAALAALLGAQTAAAAPACAALDGTYAVESTEKPEGGARSLTELAADKERAKLFHRETQSAGAPGFTSSGTRARPRVTRLASTVRLTVNENGEHLAYLDAAGKVLSDAPMGKSPVAWKCVSARLERHFETTGGLGENVRTERTEQALFAAPGGDLHLVESISVVGKAAGAPQRTEVSFKRAAKP
jgi:hypothetical protein